MSFAVTETSQKIDCLRQVLRLNPEHAQAQARLKDFTNPRPAVGRAPEAPAEAPTGPPQLASPEGEKRVKPARVPLTRPVAVQPPSATPDETQAPAPAAGPPDRRRTSRWLPAVVIVGLLILVALVAISVYLLRDEFFQSLQARATLQAVQATQQALQSKPTRFPTIYLPPTWTPTFTPSPTQTPLPPTTEAPLEMPEETPAPQNAALMYQFARLPGIP